MALLIPIVCGIAMLAIRYKFTFMGYEQGRKLASGLGGQLKRLTDAASVLGLTVVGALVPSVVKAPMNISIVIGDTNPINLQSMLDKIMPAALPLAIVLLSYWLLGKKKMTTVKLILILMVVGVGLGLLTTFFAPVA